MTHNAKSVADLVNGSLIGRVQNNDQLAAAATNGVRILHIFYDARQFYRLQYAEKYSLF